MQSAGTTGNLAHYFKGINKLTPHQHITLQELLYVQHKRTAVIGSTFYFNDMKKHCQVVPQNHMEHIVQLTT